MIYSISYSSCPPSEEQVTMHIITTYVWSNYYGEFDNESQEFIAWELKNDDPTKWIKRPDIMAPPKMCNGSETIRIKRTHLASQQWTQLSPNIWRVTSITK